MAKRWFHVDIWLEYEPLQVSKSDLDELFDVIADAAHEAEPPGTDAHISGVFNDDPPDWSD